MIAERRPGRPRLLRGLNDRNTLALLLRHGPLTRRQISELTGLSKVTAGHAVQRLLDRGLVVKAGGRTGSGHGPDAACFTVGPRCGYVVGVEVGPGRAAAACADMTDTVIGWGERSMPNADDWPAATLAAVLAALDSAGVSTDEVSRVVLGHCRQSVAGGPSTSDDPLDWCTELAVPGRGADLSAKLSAHLRCPVEIESGVNLAAIAEARDGVARDTDDFLLLWLDRAVHLSIVLGGKPRRTAGELVDVVGDGPRDHRHPDVDGARVDRRIGELARRHARLVATVCLLIDPPLVVLGGEVGRAGGEPLAQRLRTEVSAIVPMRPPMVVTATVERPVLRGALLAAAGPTREDMLSSLVEE
jgi:predicted NBD/HSP70 family sugar kinase